MARDCLECGRSCPEVGNGLAWGCPRCEVVFVETDWRVEEVGDRRGRM